MSSASSTLATHLVRRPVLSTIIVLMIMAVSLFDIRSIEIDASTDGFIDANDPARPAYDDFVQTFGSDILTALIITPPQGDVFNIETITLVDDLAYDIEMMDGVDSVESMITVKNIKSDEESIITDALIEDLPETEDDLAGIKRDAYASKLIMGNVISKDGRHTAINIYTKASDDKDFEKVFLGELEKLIEEKKGEHQVYQVGTPRYNVTFNSYIQRDQITLVPFAVLAIILVLLFHFRNAMSAILPMITASVSIVNMAGFMAWMDFSITAISVIAPSVIIVVGCTEDVHIVSKYRYHLSKDWTKVEAIHATMMETILPITLTSLTTIVGFGVLAISDITAVKEFGIICAFGLFANFIVTTLLTPVVFRIFPAPPPATHKEGEPKGKIGKLLTLVNDAHHKGRPIIACLTLGLVILAITGATKVELNNDPISFFKTHSDIRQDFDQAAKDMAGTQTFHITFETDPGDVKDPAVLKRIAGLQAWMEESGKYDKTISLADFMKLMNRAFNNDEKAYKIPNDRNLIAQYLLLLEPEDVERYVNYDFNKTAILVRHGMSGSADVKQAIKEIETWIETYFSHYTVDNQIKTLKYDITGEPVLLHRATDALINGQIKSLFIALFVIMIIISALFLSVKAGLVAMVSNTVPILCNFGVMGWLGIPFNTGTCLVATIALGIAVDDTIHFMVHYQRSLRHTNDQKAALKHTLYNEGHPIMITSTALALGFAVMSYSQFNPTMYFGILAALIMVYAVTTDLFVNPLMLLSVQLITLWDYLKLGISSHALKESLVLRGLTEREAKTVVLLGSLKTVPGGERFLTEGDHGEDMYLILSGEVDISANSDDGPQHIATLGEGALVGEMAWLGEGRRSANATAKVQSELLRLDEKALERVKRRNPAIAAKIFTNIASEVTKRLVEANKKTVQSPQPT